MDRASLVPIGVTDAVVVGAVPTASAGADDQLQLAPVAAQRGLVDGECVVAVAETAACTRARVVVAVVVAVVAEAVARVVAVAVVELVEAGVWGCCVLFRSGTRRWVQCTCPKDS